VFLHFDIFEAPVKLVSQPLSEHLVFLHESTIYDFAGALSSQ